ncbi:MAG: hypothetical protein ACFE85_17695 [Candidatus Hodarchaeota archaeon]
MSEMEEVKVGVTWRHIVVTALATGVAAILAIFAVIVAPVAPFPGVSGLYLAAAIYVPLSLWLGGWGCIAGYVSCVILGYVSTPFGVWSWLWSFADLFEGLLPLLAFRLFKADVDIGADLKRENSLYLLLAVLVGNLIIAAVATAINLPIVWFTTYIIAIILLFVMYLMNPSKSWLLFVVFGIFGAAIVSALWGIWIPILGGFAPVEGYWIGVIGWFAGDVIVLSAIATPLMITLTGKIKQTSVFVEHWFT